MCYRRARINGTCVGELELPVLVGSRVSSFSLVSEGGNFRIPSTRSVFFEFIPVLPAPHHKGAVVWYSFGYCLSSLCRFGRKTFFRVRQGVKQKNCASLLTILGRGTTSLAVMVEAFPTPEVSWIVSFVPALLQFMEEALHTVFAFVLLCGRSETWMKERRYLQYR